MKNINRDREKDKMFIVRKYIKARSASEAIKKDKTVPVHDVWIDEDWKKNSLASAIGFVVEHEEEK